MSSTKFLTFVNIHKIIKNVFSSPCKMKNINGIKKATAIIINFAGSRKKLKVVSFIAC